MPGRRFITPNTNPMPVSLCTSQNTKVMRAADTKAKSNTAYSNYLLMERYSRLLPFE